MALAAKAMGMKVITLTSLKYTNGVTSRHSSGKLVRDVADIVIDMGGIKGDAALHRENVKENFCSPSTIIGMSILVGLVGEVIVKLADQGIEVPIWVSGNLDRGDAVNQEYIKNYHGKVVSYNISSVRKIEMSKSLFYNRKHKGGFFYGTKYSGA